MPVYTPYRFMRVQSCVENKERNKEQLIPRSGSTALIFRKLDASHNHTYIHTLEIINTDSINDKVLPLEIKRQARPSLHHRDLIHLI